MRLLIAGGGTGGHIYPALAVASSLRARLGTPELDWVGGHRAESEPGSLGRRSVPTRLACASRLSSRTAFRAPARRR